MTSSLQTPQIKGLIFDFGSVLCYSTSKTTKVLMHNGMKNKVSEHFNLSPAKTEEFFNEFQRLSQEFKQRKLFIASGTVLDESFIHEYKLSNQISDALINIGQQFPENNTITKEILEDIMSSYRTPNVENAMVIEGLHAFLDWCQKQNILCSICSNYNDSIRTLNILKKFNIYKYFNPIIISSHICFRKPDCRITDDILKHPNWKNISLSDIIFIGDNPHTDMLCAQYSLLRSIQTKFYDRNGSKFHKRVVINADETIMKLAKVSYMNDSSKVVLKYMSDTIGLTLPDAIANNYSEIPKLLDDISCQPYTKRALIIGLYILPHKIKKFEQRQIFQMDHRRDIIFKKIDFKRSMADQGPFDILIHKLTSWYVAADYDVEVRLQLHDCLQYINMCHTNLKSEMKSFDGQSFGDSNNYQMDDECKHMMYIIDDPQMAKRTTDRYHMYQTINHARIMVDNELFVAPDFMLLTVNDVQMMKDIEFGNGDDMKSTDVSNLKNNILSFHFPVIVKPRIGVSPVVNGGIKNLKSVAHHMFIVPCAHLLYDTICEFEDKEWIIQEYIDHKQHCHKVYCLGDEVFATVNDSTPDIECLSTEQHLFINSGKFSKKCIADQSERKYGKLYENISKQMRDAFGLECLGYDLIFDGLTNRGYIIDCNYYPGYKNVCNFSAIFWAYLLEKYFAFISQNSSNKKKSAY